MYIFQNLSNNTEFKLSYIFYYLPPPPSSLNWRKDYLKFFWLNEQWTGLELWLSLVTLKMWIWCKRNQVFATNSNFLIPISLRHNFVDLRYFKLWILLDQIFWIWNIKGLQHQIPKVYIFEFVPKTQFLYKLTVRKNRKIENRIPLLHLPSCYKHLICRGLVFAKVLV